MAYEIAQSIVAGRKVVTTAATAVKLLDNVTHCYRVDISADLGNTGVMVVGGSTVVAALGSQVGIVLTPGNPPLTILVNDVSKIYVDAQNSGDSICFVYYVQ